MYKRGLGDQEVIESSSAAAEPISVGALGTTMTIEEGDEEEEERLEQEEEQREQEEQTEAQIQLKIQEDAWEQVDQLRAAEAQSATTTVGGSVGVSPETRLISYNEALDHFTTASYVNEHLDSIIAYERTSKGCLSCIGAAKLSFPKAIQQRDMVGIILFFGIV